VAGGEGGLFNSLRGAESHNNDQEAWLKTKLLVIVVELQKIITLWLRNITSTVPYQYEEVPKAQCPI